MKTVALVSGGKDSCYNMLLCERYGHEVVALANLMPHDEEVDELDSYMYQTVGHQLVAAYAACTGLPLYRRRIRGVSKHQGMSYTLTDGDEVEDLLALLAFAKQDIPGLQAVASGAIASDYQRLRVENVCARLGLVSLAYLWHQPQAQLLDCMISSGIQAVLVKVAAMGLDPARHLGRSLSHMRPHLHRLRGLYGCNICGEGGEYETLTLDCPLFRRGRIVLDSAETRLHSPDTVAPVGVLHPLAFHVERKTLPVTGHARHTGPPATDATPEGGAAGSTAGSGPPAGHSPAGRPLTPRDDAGVGPARVIDVPPDFRPEVGRSGGGPPASGRGETAPAVGCGGVLTVGVRQGAVGVQAWCAAGGHGGVPEERVTSSVGRALSALAQELCGRGLGLGDALLVKLYISDMAYFGAANAEYCRHFPASRPPARACVQAPLPAGVHALVDVALPSAGFDAAKRRVLHVQSISEWAPSCIGPYSQATAHNGLLHMAGQIGLDPPTMNLVSGGAQAQAQRCMGSCQAVAVAMGTDLRQGMIACTLYAPQERPRENLAALESALEGFLDGHDSPVPPETRHIGSGAELQCSGPEEGRKCGGGGGGQEESHEGNGGKTAEEGGGEIKEGEGGEEEEGEEGEEEEEEFVDSYLQVPDMQQRTWRPLTTYLVMEALPRAAVVEVQPLACIGQTLVTDATDTDSDDDAHDPGTSKAIEQRASCSQGKRGSLTNHTRCVEIDGGANPGRLQIHALAVDGRFCRVHVDYTPHSVEKLVGEGKDSVERTERACMEGGGTEGAQGENRESVESAGEGGRGTQAGLGCSGDARECGESVQGLHMGCSGDVGETGESEEGLHMGCSGDVRERGESEEGLLVGGRELGGAVEAAMGGAVQALSEAGLGLGDVVEVALFYNFGLVGHGVQNGTLGSLPDFSGAPPVCIPVLAVGSDSTAASVFQLQVTASRL